MTVPRMRTIKEAVAELKQEDNKSAVTVYYVRGLVLSGKLPYMAVGNKRLVDLNKLIEYLSNPIQQNSTADELNHIKRID